MAVHPYWYPQVQKDELEHHCVAMMEQGIICTITSPFSSPMLLIKKTDRS
jgi:hypothetical protein